MAGTRVMSGDSSERWPETEITAFQKAVIGWFEAEGRHDLPWRQTRDPYLILVSELMLQQTQVGTVLKRGFFENWVALFPDVESLAGADEAVVLKAWEGLGYYNRARNLQRAARVIVEEWGGVFPEDEGDILALPGVGRYTAGAVLSCAFGKSAAVVDGNVVRVFSRLFAELGPVDTTAGGRKMWERAEWLVPENGAGKYNAGLMELGQRVCRRGRPDCDGCPVRAHCRGLKGGVVLDLPVKRNRVKVEDRTEHVVFCRRGKAIFLRQEEGKRRRGLWRLPVVEASAAARLPELFRMKYAITKYRVEMVVHRGGKKLVEGEGAWCLVPEETDGLALAAPDRKVLDRLMTAEFCQKK